MVAFDLAGTIIHMNTETQLFPHPSMSHLFSWTPTSTQQSTSLQDYYKLAICPSTPVTEYVFTQTHLDSHFREFILRNWDHGLLHSPNWNQLLHIVYIYVHMDEPP